MIALPSQGIFRNGRLTFPLLHIAFCAVLGRSLLADAQDNNLDHLTWDPIASPQQSGVPFQATVSARDSQDQPLPSFNSSVFLSGRIPGSSVALVISELDVVGQRIEFTNPTATPVDISGWRVDVYGVSTWPQPAANFLFPKGMLVPVGGVFQFSAFGDPNSNYPFFVAQRSFNWSTNDASAPFGVLLRDLSGKVVDFVSGGGCNPAQISEAHVATLWTGSSLELNQGPATLQRKGNFNHFNAADWETAPDTIGIQNPDLRLPFLADETLIPITPASILLENGTWTGPVTVLEPGAGVSFLADSGNGQSGVCNPFDVLPPPPLSLRVPESTTEALPDSLLPCLISIPTPIQADLPVSLSSSDPSEISVPDSIIIPAGSLSVTFDATNHDNLLVDGTQRIVVTVTSSGFATAKAVIFHYDYEIATLTLTLPTNAREGQGLLANQAIVRMSPGADKDVDITITTSDPGSLQVPADVTIPAGQSAASFDLYVPDNNRIDGARTVVVSASVTNWNTALAQITIADNETFNLTLSVLAAVLEGSGLMNGAGTVAISGILTSNLVIQLHSDTPSRVSVPDTVTIPAGQVTASFDLMVLDNNETDGAQTVTIYAVAPGFVSDQRPLKVFDNDVHHFSFGPLDPSYQVATPFNVAVTARTIDEFILTNYTGNFQLSLQYTVDQPPSPLFTALLTNGVWTGTVTLSDQAHSVRLLATDSVGHRGESDSFDVGRVQILDLPVSDLVFHSPSGRILAGLMQAAGKIGQSLASIDPLSGTIASTLPLGSQPGRLAMSDDARFLYIALLSTGGVARVNLDADAVDLQYSFGPADPQLGNPYAEDLKVLPGNPDALAVSLRTGPNITPIPSGEYVYDLGVARRAISLTSGLMEATFPLGSDARRLAVADNGRYIYAGVQLRDLTTTDTAATDVYRVDLAQGAIDLRFAVRDFLGQLHKVTDMKPVPGEPTALAIAQRGPQNDIEIYENGNPTKRSRTDLNCRYLEFSDSGARLYGVPYGPGHPLFRMDVTADGIAMSPDVPGLFSAMDTDIRYASGRLYATSGEVVDPEAGVAVAQLPVSGLVQPDPASGRIYYITQPDSGCTLMAFDQSTFSPLWSFPVPGVLGQPTRFVRCGPGLLAFSTTAGQIFILNSAQLPGEPVADLQVTQSVSPESAAVGDSITFTTTVTNLGPDSATGVIVTNAIPPGAAFISVSSSQGTCTNLDGQVLCTLGDLAPGIVATISLVVLTTEPGTLVNVAGASLTSQDRDLSDNTAVARIYVSSPTQDGIQVIDLPTADLAYDPFISSSPGLINGWGVAIKFADGFVFATSGAVIDPISLTLKGTFQPPSPGAFLTSTTLVEPDLDHGRVYFLVRDGDWKLIAYDSTLFVPLGALRLPTLRGTPSSLIRWGADGLAFRTDQGQLFLCQRSKVQGVDLSVSHEASADPVTLCGQLIYTVTVTNRGPATARNVVLQDILPANVALAAMAASRGDVSVAGNTLSAQFGSLTNGASVTLRIVTSATAPGLALNQATVSTDDFDLQPADNIAQIARTVTANGGLSLVNQYALPSTDLAYDSTRHQILASLATSLGGIIPFDVDSAGFSELIPVESPVGKLAISDNDQYLYLAMSTGGVARVDLEHAQLDLRFSLGSDDRGTTPFVGDMAVMPGHPQTLAVSRGLFGLGGANYWTVIYDNGVPRSNAVGPSDYGGVYPIQFATPSLLFSAYPFTLRQISVDASGAALVNEFSGLVPNYDIGFTVSQGLLYFYTGRVVDPNSQKIIGNLPKPGLIVPDLGHNKIYLLSQDPTSINSPTTLTCCAADSLALLWSIPIPGVSGSVGSFIQCGDGRLAFRTDSNQLFVLRTSLIPDAPAADLITVSLTALTVDNGPLTSTASVTSSTAIDPKLQDNSATLTLNDHVNLLSISDLIIGQNSIDTTTAVFSVRLARADTQSVAVDYLTGNGTAMAGIDFAPKTGTLLFSAGVSDKNVSVPILRTRPSQGTDKSFYLVLLHPVNASLGVNEAKATILTPTSEQSLQITSFEILNGTISLQFPSQTGRYYQVEQRDTLLPASWSPLGDLLLGTGNPVQARFPEPAAVASFYRIRLQP
jgi:uncharacterized repeat protein (TIGR01451 family)